MTTPQSNPLADPRTIIVRLEQTPDGVRVHWADGHASVFPVSWLRHGCDFPAHRNAHPVPPETITPETITPESLALGPDGGLEIAWRPDGETTRHPAAWLRDRCPSRAERSRRRRPTRDWPNGKPPELAYHLVTDDGRGLLAFYRALLDYGLVILRDVPPEDGQVARVAALVGPLHETGYGRVVDVKTTSELAIEANTSKRLEPHTDESYRYSPPGISLFHCLAAAPGDGGESLLVDGYAVAGALRDRAPEAFELLCREPLGFTDTGGGAHYFARGWVISLDLDGTVVGIRYSDRALLPLDLPPARIEPVYQALRAWADLLYDPRFLFSYRMAPGDLHVFDNHRVLHGRTAFSVGQGIRHLQQCAVDRDEFHSNFRMLAKRLGQADWAGELPGGALT